MYGAYASAPSARRRTHWDAGTVAACCLLLACAIGLLATTGSLTAVTALHGRVVGAGCVALAALGVLASSIPLPAASSPCLGSPSNASSSGWASGAGVPLRIALLVGLGLAALGSLQLVGQVATDVGAHCVVAEAAVRIGRLEEALTKLKHDEMLTQVFFRLNELDDMMAAAAHGSTAHVQELKDSDYIRERVGRLRLHAHQLLDEMQASVEGARADMQAANATQPATPASMEELVQEKARQQREADARRAKEEAVWLAERRIDAVHNVLQYIDARAHDAHAELSIQEYEVILEALLEGAANIMPQPAAPPPPAGAPEATPSGGPPVRLAIVQQNLERDKDDIDHMRERMQRRQHGYAPAKAATDLQARREQARAQFEDQFFKSFEAGAGATRRDIYQRDLAQALDSLPRHCLDDVAAYGVLRWLVPLLVVAQAAAAFAAATALAARAVAPGKMD